MSTMTTTAVKSPTVSTGRSDKSKKQSRVITLHLPPRLLTQFAPIPPTREEKSTPSSASSPAAANPEIPSLKVTESHDNASESNSTPAPPQDASTPAEGPPKKRKGPLPGSKRAASQMTDGLPKPRGKPGPKKKPRLEDGTIDHSARPSLGVGATTTHKLGPKANQGAINAGLRALDRSGKPCRKWARRSFKLKSFTGVAWELPSWKGGDTSMLVNGDDSSETKDISLQSSSDVKPAESDTAMDSNAGDQPDPMILSTPAASSPAPIPPQSSIIAAQG